MSHLPAFSHLSQFGGLIGCRVGRENRLTVADETLARIEGEDLKGLGRADIDDVIEYVHVPTARLPAYLSLYDRYLRQRWNVNELDFTPDRAHWTHPSPPDPPNSSLSTAPASHP